MLLPINTGLKPREKRGRRKENLPKSERHRVDVSVLRGLGRSDSLRAQRAEVACDHDAHGRGHGGPTTLRGETDRRVRCHLPQVRHNVGESSPLRETCLRKDHSLADLNPHECVPFLNDTIPDLTSLPTPRLFGTHVPIVALPARSGCRIVYVWRDPKDTFVSLWHFVKKILLPAEILPLEEAFEMFYDGRVPYGPYFEHVLGYLKAAEDQTNNILVIKYEKLMEDPKTEVMRLARFVGKPFNDEEVERGLVEDVIDLCSFERLKNAKGNKSGEVKLADYRIKKDAFFRQGKVGDWVNYLSAEMGRKLDQIAKDKFSEFGLHYITN